MTVLKLIMKFLSVSEYNLKPGNFYNILITGSTDFDLFGNQYNSAPFSGLGGKTLQGEGGQTLRSRGF